MKISRLALVVRLTIGVFTTAVILASTTSPAFAQDQDLASVAPTEPAISAAEYARWFNDSVAELPNPSAPQPSAAVVAASAVGRTPATFSVTNSGVATYQVPIWVPPGTHGLQPDLALTYGHTSGNGLVGMGWGIAGLATINRCNKSLVTGSGFLSPI
jgi:hypothetical protein